MDPLKNVKNPASAFMLFLVLCFIGISFLNEFLALVLIESGVPREVFASMWYLILVQLLRLLLPLFIWLAITKDSFMRHMPHQPLGKMNIIYIFFISILALPALMFISGITSFFVNNDAAEMLAGFTGAGHSWWAMMLAIAVTPGIVEEVVFRGYIQSVTPGKKFLRIALMNGLLFGLMHMNLHQFLYTFVLGVAFAYLVHFTRSIWGAIFAHFLVNGINVSLMHWAAQANDYSPETVAEQSFPQIMYETFAETDPELAQRLYDLFSDVSIEVIGIGFIGFIAIFATIGLVALYGAFINHNRKRNAQFDETQIKITGITENTETDRQWHKAASPLCSSQSESSSQEYEKAAPPLSAIQSGNSFPGDKKPFHTQIDWYLVSVIVIYIVFTLIF